MSSKAPQSTKSVAIAAHGLAKWYAPLADPSQRFWEALRFGNKISGDLTKNTHKTAAFALHPISFQISEGEVVGIVGKNGAGKSTLLQLLCGTLQPSAGSVQIQGKIAALLELGSGFNPEFTGLENVRLNAAILGLSSEEIADRLDSILSFADIGDYVDRPVKTYSSGMFVRLAFSVAVCVDPQILVVDEALSVGDGQFARKSFQRIMELKEAGTTILFCSHSLYQVESLCDRALWLDQGQLKMQGDAADVIAAYAQFLDSGQATAVRMALKTHQTSTDSQALSHQSAEQAKQPDNAQLDNAPSVTVLPRITRVEASIDGQKLDLTNEAGRRRQLKGTGQTLAIEIHFTTVRLQSDDSSEIKHEGFERPTIALTVMTASGLCVTSVSTLKEPHAISINENGHGYAVLHLDALPLRRGIFRIDALLGCPKALQLYDQAVGVIVLDVRSEAAEQGLIAVNHRWEMLR